MEEITLKLKHKLPFSNISIKFPGTMVLRWCNSNADYLEFSGRNSDFSSILFSVEEFASSIGSRVLFNSQSETHLSVMISCKCALDNSTVRVAESMNCVVRNPVVYSHGDEFLTIISLMPEHFTALGKKLAEFAEIEVTNKHSIDYSDFRNIWNISLSDLFHGMTQKQLSILSDAISSGYFNIPKRVELKEISKKYGISNSTMQEHLSKAETRIMYAMESYLRMYNDYLLSVEKENREKI